MRDVVAKKENAREEHSQMAAGNWENLTQKIKRKPKKKKLNRVNTFLRCILSQENRILSNTSLLSKRKKKKKTAHCVAETDSRRYRGS